MNICDVKGTEVGAGDRVKHSSFPPGIGDVVFNVSIKGN